MLVALAGQKDRVARLGPLEELANRGPTIQLDRELLALDGACLTGALGDRPGNGGRIFVTRVVRERPRCGEALLTACSQSQASGLASLRLRAQMDRA